MKDLTLKVKCFIEFDSGYWRTTHKLLMRLLIFVSSSKLIKALGSLEEKRGL
jgi:hypothetical protein